MSDGAAQVSKEELTANLLKRASDEIRQLRQHVQHQGAQLIVLEKLAKIAGWQDQPQGASPDICWEIDRFVSTTARSMPIQESE